MLSNDELAQEALNVLVENWDDEYQWLLDFSQMTQASIHPPVSEDMEKVVARRPDLRPKMTFPRRTGIKWTILAALGRILHDDPGAYPWEKLFVKTPDPMPTPTSTMLYVARAICRRKLNTEDAVYFVHAFRGKARPTRGLTREELREKRLGNKYL
jgi:hypothetical protein